MCMLTSMAMHASIIRSGSASTNIIDMVIVNTVVLTETILTFLDIAPFS